MRLIQDQALVKLLTAAITAMALSTTTLAPLAEAQRGDRGERMERAERGDRGDRGQRGNRGGRHDQGHRGDRVSRLAGGPGAHRDGSRGHRGDRARGDQFRGEGHRGNRHNAGHHGGRFKGDHRSGYKGSHRNSKRGGHKGGFKTGYHSGYRTGYKDARRDTRHFGGPRHLNTLPRHLPKRQFGHGHGKKTVYSHRRKSYHGGGYHYRPRHSGHYYRTPRYIDRPFYNRFPNRYYTPRYKIGGVYRHYHGRTVIIHDYYRFGLYDPPYGYHWVRDRDRGDAILASVATGAIIGLAIGILSH